MKRLIERARSPFKRWDQKVLKQVDVSSTIPTPTVTDVMRYRYHHGTNLGSIFVLEQWLSPSMFVNGAGGSSELDAVTASLRQSGLEGTRRKWEEHWRTAVSNGDWDWLVNVAHCTTIRLPIGYFTLGPNFCGGTPFEGEPSQVYVNAWFQVKEFVARARAYGIGVLLDFHALPGGANGDAHSGTSSSQAALWGNQYNLDLARRCLVFIAQEAKYMDGVVGVQLVNESVRQANGMYAWYDSVIGAIAPIDASMPIYISDAWDLRTGINYAKGKNTIGNSTNSVIVDTHKYYTFDEADKQQSPQQIIERVNNELGELNGNEGNVVSNGAVSVLIGEYSCVLDERTWSRVDANQRGPLILQFGQAQSRKWQTRAGGSCFWTYKMDWMDGGEWGFAQQTKAGAVTPPAPLRISHTDVNARLGTAQSQRTSRKNGAVSAHVSFWDKTAPQQRYEHWRYENGWDVGYTDAMTFFGARANRQLSGPGGDKIGMLDVWVRKRIKDSGQGGSYLWEFEHGLRKGIADFYAVVGLRYDLGDEDLSEMPLSSTRSSFFDGQHDRDSSKLAKRPRQIRHRPERLHGRRRREVREHSASLDSISLGKPAQIVVLRDANLNSSEGTTKPILDISASTGKEGEHVSTQDLLESLSAGQRYLSTEDVRTHLELLRPKSDEDPLSQAKCNELAHKLLEGFTIAQLTRYMHDIRKAAKLGSERNAGEDGMLQWEQDDKMGMIRQSEWRLGVTPNIEPGDILPTLDDSDKLSRKARLVSRLLKDYWKVQIREDIESMGELELKLPPLEMSLLLGDKRKLLKDVCERRRAKLDVFRSKGMIKITTDKESASSVVSDIRAVLSHLQCMQMDLKPFRASDGGNGAVNEYIKESKLQAISEVTGTEIAIQKEADTLAIYTLGPDMTPAYDARRLILSQLRMPFQYQEQNLCERDLSIDEAALTSIGPVNDLAWYERGISWSRLQSPASKEASGNESQPDGILGVNEDHEKIARSIQAFLKKTGGTRAQQGDVTIHAEHRPSELDMDADLTTSEERGVKREPRTESKTIAIVGYILQETEKPSFIRPATGETQIRNRTFSHNVPGLLRSLSPLSAVEPKEPSESLLIQLQPSPWSSPQNSNLFPSIEILINIDPLTKANNLQTVRAIISHQISDLALPDKLADVRFQRRTNINLQNPSNSPAINAFLAQSNLDIRSQGRLLTPPSLKLKIPQWTLTSNPTPTPSSSEKEHDEEVEMDYLFSALSHHQTLPLHINGWKAQYTTIEAGKAGGRRGEFQIIMERAPPGEDGSDHAGVTPYSAVAAEGSEGPSQTDFNHFFTTALRFVGRLETWV